MSFAILWGGVRRVESELIVVVLNIGPNEKSLCINISLLTHAFTHECSVHLVYGSENLFMGWDMISWLNSSLFFDISEQNVMK